MEDLFSKAVEEVDNLHSGEEFIVKDLFKGYEWKRISIDQRMGLGREFFRSEKNPHLASYSITPLNKTDDGQQIYKKN